ncbi:IS200/IS605 family transposase [Candidatus Woesearchaeota archaeon]|nr:IS200/IS605 family transposase [Candidatus Woesearchaeota archaeon]
MIFISDEFIHYSHSIGNNVHQLEWCTKYRYEMLKNSYIREELRQILYEVANRFHIKIIESGIMPDHVHLVVQLHPSMSQSRATQLLKGASSYELFCKFPNLRLRYPQCHLWSRGNFKDSVGRNTQENAEHYVREKNNLSNDLIRFCIENFILITIT